MTVVERYAQILQSASETAIITMDIDGTVTGWSPGAWPRLSAGPKRKC